MVAHCELREKAVGDSLCGRYMPTWLDGRFVWVLALALAVSIAAPAACYAQTDASATQSSSQAISNAELLEQIKEMRSEINSLRARLDAKESPDRSVSPQGEPVVSNVATSVQEPPETSPAAQDQGRPQYTGRPDNASVAMATKANGGDLSGAGNLLRTERVTLGVYGDFQFRTPALNERADGGGTSTFQSTRFVLGLAAVLSQKQNITFNSEIEYELGTSEIDVEQAFVSWRVRPEFDFRGGIIVPPLGRFNTYHDSNINITTLRPLINQYIVPTAYRDAGVGLRGVLRLPREMKVSYEADVVNGFRAFNADG